MKQKLPAVDHARQLGTSLDQPGQRSLLGHSSVIKDMDAVGLEWRKLDDRVNNRFRLS